MLLLVGVLVLASAAAVNAVSEEVAKGNDPPAAPDLIGIERLWLSSVARALLLLRCESSAAVAAAAAAAASDAALEGITEYGAFNDRAGVVPDIDEYALGAEVASPISCLVADIGLAELGGADASGAPGGAVVADHAALVRGGAADDDDVNAPDVGGFLLVEVRYADDRLMESSGVCRAGFRSRLAMAVLRSAIAGAPFTLGSDSSAAAAEAGGDAPSPLPPPPLLPCRRLAAASRRAMAAADVSREGGCWLLIVCGNLRSSRATDDKQHRSSRSPATVRSSSIGRHTELHSAHLCSGKVARECQLQRFNLCALLCRRQRWFHSRVWSSLDHHAIFRQRSEDFTNAILLPHERLFLQASGRTFV